ncbi:MAG: hypothetical protein SFU53_00225 [Terrimicrobiaceae bacterium]|nr:hypothetical protein [Terrimicrobiaceae bacterium]
MPRKNRKPAGQPKPAAPAAEPETKGPGGRRTWWVAGGIAALGLYLACARGDLWLDEIWSLEWARGIVSPSDLIAKYRHDNNHVLNTAWLWLAGPSAPPWLYRLPAALSGTAALMLLAALASRIQRGAGIFAWVLGFFSFPFVLYFSEARGYAMAAACGTAAAWLLLRQNFRPSWLSVAGFSILSIVGLLSHSTFVLVLLALGIWTSWASWSGRVGLVAARLAMWFGFPLVAAVSWYFMFLKGMEIGGGPEFSIAVVLGHFFGHGLGLPITWPWSVIAIALGVALLAAGWHFTPDRQHHLRALLCGVIIAPVLVLLATRPTFLYFRYFFVLLPFIYLFAAVAMAGIWKMAWPSGRVAVVSVLALYVLSQAMAVGNLVRFGRGQYSDALLVIASSPDADKSLTSDHDFRNGMLVGFLQRRDARFESIRYMAGAPQPAKWHLLHTQDPLPSEIPTEQAVGSATYRLTGIFPYGGVSGWHWILYRRD